MRHKCRENRPSGPFSRLGWMGSRRAVLILLVVGLLAVAVSGCGSEDSPDLLPGETAGDIKANLNLVEELVAAGDCVGAANAAAAVREQVDGLSGVDAALKEALVKGAGRLNEVIGECEEAAEEDGAETTEPLEPDQRETEQREKDEEREERQAEREAEKEQKEQEKEEREPPEKEKSPEEPEEPEVQPVEPPTPPSGGVSPSSPAGGGE